jgi:hypothetical protein
VYWCKSCLLCICCIARAAVVSGPAGHGLRQCGSTALLALLTPSWPERTHHHPSCLCTQDIAELARLKILGSKLKKSTARREPPSAVLQAIQQQRQEYQGSGSGAGPGGSTAGGVASGDGSSMAGLPLLQTQRTLMHLKSLRGAFTGLQDEEEEEGQAETPLVRELTQHGWMGGWLFTVQICTAGL